MSMLDRKLFRDLGRLWAQALAIALVMACGVATLILAEGAYRSLHETRAAFYERYRFANVFVSATRAPLETAATIKAIDGVSGAVFRISKPVLLDMPGMAEPAAGMVLSLPDFGEPDVNRLYIRSGRLPAPGSTDEAVILESFADAHRLKPGSHFTAIMNGARRDIQVTGIVLSPEFIYTIGPGDLVPDPRRFGIFYMAHSRLAGIFGMTGAYNDVSLRTTRSASEAAVIDAVDNVLKPYGGAGAHGRDRQTSHTFLDNEMIQLDGMAKVIPPIFLGVAAFLINMILSRLIALEREQIGLLKALGFSEIAIGLHYAKLTLVIAALGFAVGAGLGNWSGRALTQLYTEFFSFPFLIFIESADLYIIAAGVTGAAALAGAARAIWNVVKLPAAVAMRPPAPLNYSAVLPQNILFTKLFSQLNVMAMRGIIRRPMRTALTTLGTSLSVALLITAFASMDSVDSMVEEVFFRAARQDASLTFITDLGPAAALAAAKMPGVMRAESFRSVPVVLRAGYREKHLAITALDPKAGLTRILDTSHRPVTPPPNGLMISDHLARFFGVRPGDMLDVELIKRNHAIVSVPVTGIVQSYIGLETYMQADALDHLSGEGQRVSGVWLSVDRTMLNDLYAAVKQTPAVASIALQGVSRQNFRDTINQNIETMTFVYSLLAVIITFGVVYNSARIQLSERARELASLRVFGFTRWEVSGVLLFELGVIALAAQPVGWIVGYFFSKLVIDNFASDLFRMPFVINSSTFAYASGVVLFAAVVSALVVRRRIDHLDLVRVLKTRE
ncbi:ABC transporter permease [Rhizobium sp. L1K21]|uniref:ABC transporter permease n=1 Tax=Rhizobium sp. L1K21 TaxID=2954933 RepID=UPI002092112C|nr:FtsX-like permease family protein [Rhizobium sp. L1K21]MCO6186459.1 FtsX-like permease family protein [Rhizobium sp. L1K21]